MGILKLRTVMAFSTFSTNTEYRGLLVAYVWCQSLNSRYVRPSVRSFSICYIFFFILTRKKTSYYVVLWILKR